MEVIAACEFMTGGMGYQNTLPWKIKSDMRMFKHITMLAPVGKLNMIIMGRNTWDSIGKHPLAGRFTIVVSKTLPSSEIHGDMCRVDTLDEAIDLGIKSNDIHKIFVVGGRRLYQEALEHPYCAKAYITYVHRPPGSTSIDTYFPLNTLYREFEVVHRSHLIRDEFGVYISMFKYKRRVSF
jgi:dihydrofolate reductase